MTIGDRIKSKRESLGITQTALADLIGTTKQNLYKYENGIISNIPSDKVEALASALHTTPAYLMGWEDRPSEKASSENYLPVPDIAEDVVTFPVITSVAAHYDACSYGDNLAGETVDIPANFLRGRPREDYCVMRVKGDSMYPDFRNDDLVLVLKQSTLNRPRDIGVIIYGEDEMTLKRIDYVPGEDWLEMIPINPNYPPKRIEGAELERCRVIGIPRLLLREM